MATVCEMMKRDGDGEQLAEGLLNKLDANQDGKISQAEAINACVTDESLRELLNLSINKHFQY